MELSLGMRGLLPMLFAGAAGVMIAAAPVGSANAQNSDIENLVNRLTRMERDIRTLNRPSLSW